MNAVFTKINESFICEYCQQAVQALQNGSCRNHCPHCLCSKHVDISPGDRANPCQGRLQALAYDLRGKKGLRIQFRCERCGQIIWNIASCDDPGQPDDYQKILALSSIAKDV